MIEITENQILLLKNIVCYRGKIRQEKIDTIGRDMEMKVNSKGGKRVGNPITATYGVENGIADIEIILPVDVKIDDLGKYCYKEEVAIKNAVKLEYQGEADGMTKACEELNTYMARKELKPITPAYNLVEIQKNNGSIQMNLKVYVGV